ncbi:pentatricopeptide repeat-containing protein At2g29760, chloroplastic-like [Olea europaea var. sylvestris]|uniref:pentatricopeptide repeat-containing protein At2g29760, chloroplastic-like n=1 Tax=Olea europaea var. sylvestris TaxID=158386 RepID=UPI000C1D4E2D|nr:pentatricopeptide repeat-containing protein At2g29760, chloroplastic-like [Olea europaea var. sylvestris]
MKLARPISRRFLTSSTTLKPERVTNYAILKDPIKEHHAHYIRIYQHTDRYKMSQIIKAYALSQTSLHKAHFIFNQIVQPTLPVWNYMIRGLSKSVQPVTALQMFDEMRESGLHGDNTSFIFVFKACAKVLNILYGRRVHAHVIKLGFGAYLFVCNSLIHMYASCGDLGSSGKVFDEMKDKDLVSWNSLICGYSQCKRYKEVLRLFNAMRQVNVKADAVTMVKVLLACSYLGEWKTADAMVRYIEENHVKIDVYLGNTLIDMYGKRGLIELARQIFDRMVERNVVSWNAMIMGYAKAGYCVAARLLFDEMPRKDVISWTSMITGYAQAAQYKDAISLFEDMMVAKVKPDEITVASVLSACAHLGMLDMGTVVHNFIRDHGVKSDIYVGNALMDMYCKCGSVENALEVFHEMEEKDSVSWTSIISGLAANGISNHALELFSQMLREGARPTHGTFVGILLACAYAGLVDKGLEFFHSMQNDYGLMPEMKHYGCVVDLLTRSGNLPQAYEFIMHMPLVPDVALWRMLLSACRFHNNLDLAEIASNKLLELDPNNGGNYVLSSSTYAGVGRWDDAIKFREQIDKTDVQRPLGWSSVEINGEISWFSKKQVPVSQYN